jgi:hypothetical protein
MIMCILAPRKKNCFDGLQGMMHGVTGFPKVFSI